MRLLLVVGAAAVALAAAAGGNATQPNVLFIISDDMRQQLQGSYPEAGFNVILPHIARLQRRGTTFSRAYTYMPICNPSRASFLTGRHGDIIGQSQHATFFRDHANGLKATTMQENFRAHGYEVRGSGKVFGVTSRGEVYQDIGRSYAEEDHAREYSRTKCPDNEPACAGEMTEQDFVEADVNGWIEELSGGEAPWLVVAGIYKPHLPYIYRPENADLYAEDAFPPAELMSLPDGACEANVSPNPFTVYSGGYLLPIGAEDQVQLRRDYFTSMFETDRMIGSFLDTLEATGAANNTIVVLMSDHGYSLGERGNWGKFVLYEEALRTPVVISAPGLGVAEDQVVDDLMSLVDVYPTVASLAGVPINRTVTEGLDYAGLLRDASVEAPREGDAAYSMLATEPGALYGYTVRTNRFRYTLWCQADRESMLPFDLFEDPANCDCEELYDHEGVGLYDYDSQELTNVVDVPAYASILRRHRKLMRRNFLDQRPEDTIPPMPRPIGLCEDGTFGLNVTFAQGTKLAVLIGPELPPARTIKGDEPCEGLLVVVGPMFETVVFDVEPAARTVYLALPNITCDSSLQVVDLDRCYGSRRLLAKRSEPGLSSGTASETESRSPSSTESRSPLSTESRSPSSTESRSPSSTESRSASSTESRSPSSTESRSPSSTESRSPSSTESRSPSSTESHSPSSTESRSPSSTESRSPSSTESRSPSSSESRSPSSTESRSPSSTESRSPSSTESRSPSSTESRSPSSTESRSPSSTKSRSNTPSATPQDSLSPPLPSESPFDFVLPSPSPEASSSPSSSEILVEPPANVTDAMETPLVLPSPIEGLPIPPVPIKEGSCRDGTFFLRVFFVQGDLLSVLTATGPTGPYVITDPEAPCPGLEVEVGSSFRIALYQSNTDDDQANSGVVLSLPRAKCGDRLQVIDLDRCAVSRLVAIRPPQ